MKTKLVFAVMIAVFCSGGSCLPDPPGGVARRHFTGQKCGSVNTQGQNDGVNSRPEGSGRLGFWTQFRMAGNDDPVEIGGIKVDIDTEFWCGDGCGLMNTTKGKAYTNDSGYAVWYVTYSSPAKGSFKIDIQTHARGARSMAGNCGVFARKCPTWTDVVGYTECFPPYGTALWPTTGEYWASGSANGAGNLTLSALGEKPSAPSSPIQNTQAMDLGLSQRSKLSSIPLTVEEESFLATEPNQFDETFLQGTAQWHIVRRSGEGYIAKPVDELTMFFEGENPDDDVIREQSTPYFVDWCFYTADSVSLAGNEFQAVVKVSPGGCDPNISDPNNYAPIKIKVIADSNDGLSHVARSGFIVPVEPNSFSPYVLATEGGDILVAPLNEGAILHFDFKNEVQFVGIAARYWLNDFRPFDVNHDGIVNLKDFLESEK